VAEERDDSQRTEDPTQRRLDEALRKGDVVKSQELATFVMTAGGALALALFAQSAAREFAARFTVFLDSPAQIVIDDSSAKSLLYKSVFGLFAILWPAVSVMILAALSGHLLQHRPLFSVSKLKPDFSKLSPIAGFKRLFGLDGFVN